MSDHTINYKMLKLFALKAKVLNLANGKIKGAESTLLLRSVYTSNDWDAYWEAHRQLEQKRLYGTVFPELGYPDQYSNKKVA